MADLLPALLAEQARLLPQLERLLALAALWADPPASGESDPAPPSAPPTRRTVMADGVPAAAPAGPDVGSSGAPAAGHTGLAVPARPPGPRAKVPTPDARPPPFDRHPPARPPAAASVTPDLAVDAPQVVRARPAGARQRQPAYGATSQPPQPPPRATARPASAFVPGVASAAAGPPPDQARASQSALDRLEPVPPATDPMAGIAPGAAAPAPPPDALMRQSTAADTAGANARWFPPARPHGAIPQLAGGHPPPARRQAAAWTFQGGTAPGGIATAALEVPGDTLEDRLADLLERAASEAGVVLP